jgi:hypothetical protein
MNNLANPSPKWLINLLPFMSGVLGGGALWYTWFTYNNLADEPEFYWYAWIRLVLMIINPSCYLPKEVDAASENKKSNFDFKTFGSHGMN